MRDEFLETIKVVDGVACNMPYHQERYERTLKLHGMTPTQNLLEWIDAPKDGLYRCRLLYSLHSQHAMTLSYHPYVKRDVQTLQIVQSNSLDYSFKYSDRRELDALFAQKKRDADEILIVQDGLIQDTSIANIAFWIDGMWVTPKRPLLAGTTRQRYLQSGKIIEANIRVQEISKVEKVALLNAMIDFDTLETFEFLL